MIGLRVDEYKILEISDGRWDWTSEFVKMDLQGPKILEIPNWIGNASSQEVCMEKEKVELDELTDRRWDITWQLVVV